MSSGHRHGNEKAASALADGYYDRARPLVDACTVDRSYQCPWLANRTRDCKIVFVDESVPVVLECGVNTDLSLPWHEIPECLAMDDGLPYDEGSPSAHVDVATPLERREVARQFPDDPDIWAKYTDEMDGYIRDVDAENLTHVPPEMDTRVFTDDGEKKIIEELIAAGADPDEGTAASPRRHAELLGRILREVSMPQILQPSDFAQRIKAGESRDAIFVDDKGNRKAKLVGLSADMEIAAQDRAIDFVISTGAIDRYNSTIAPDGWDTASFERNPVVLWMHDDFTPAIARAESTRLQAGQMRSRAIFAERDLHPLADTVYRLIKGKFINAASVGWIPLEWKFVEDKDRGFGVDYLKQELLEWSVVNIPANPECLVGARSMGIDTQPLMGWAERVLDHGGMLLVPRAEVEALRKAAGAPTVAPPIRIQNDGAKAFDDSKAALKTLLTNGLITIDQFADQLVAAAHKLDVPAERGGRVLSAENEATLRTAHGHVNSAFGHCQAAYDHCTAAMDHVMGVIAQNGAETKDPEADPEDQDPDESGSENTVTAAAREHRSRRARLLKLSASPAALNAAQTNH
jgi:HK97 family phage prohead protease